MTQRSHSRLIRSSLAASSECRAPAPRTRSFTRANGRASSRPPLRILAPDPGARTSSRVGLTGERTGQRDHALLALALATGLRAIELASLDVGDLSREWRAGVEEWWLSLPDSKTKGQSGGRILPLVPELVTILCEYLQATGRHWGNPEDHASPLFLARARKRISPQVIRLAVDRVEQQWQQSAGHSSREISPHSLRHSTAIALLEGNAANGRPPASVEHVRGWLGHMDIRTTQGYLQHLDARTHRRPFALSPVGGPVESAQ